LDFGEYCKSNWNYERDYMNERIRVANEFGEEYDGVHRSLGHTKSLLLSRMDEPQRERVLTEGVPTDEGYKTIDEATQKEINEYRRNAEEAEQRAIRAEQAKQQAESQAEQARQSEEIARKQLEEMEDKEQQVIEKEVVKEVIPVHVSEEIEQLKRNVEASKRAFESSEKELESYRLRDTVDFDEEQAEKELKKLQWEAERSVYRLINKLDDFMKEVAIFGFMEGEVAASTSATKKRLSESIE